MISPPISSVPSTTRGIVEPSFTEVTPPSKDKETDLSKGLSLRTKIEYSLGALTIPSSATMIR